MVAAMTVVDTSLDYYAVTMTVDEHGQCFVDTQTEWAGWADDARLTEIRAPSIVKPEAMIRYWKLMEQPYVVVKAEPEWFIYFQMGGNALVSEAIAEANLADTFRMMRSSPTIRIADSASSFLSL